MKSVSLITFVKNEAELLPRFVDWYSFADLTVYVDSGSTDESWRWGSKSFSWPFCEEKRRRVELEWYRSLKTDWAMFLDVDEFVRPIEKLWKWDGECVMAPFVNMTSETHGVVSGVKPVLVRTGLRGFNIGWGHHCVSGCNIVLADDVVVCHLKYDDFDRCLRRRMDRPKFRGTWGEHWLADEKAFVEEFRAAQRAAVKVL